MPASKVMIEPRIEREGRPLVRSFSRTDTDSQLSWLVCERGRAEIASTFCWCMWLATSHSMVNCYTTTTQAPQFIFTQFLLHHGCEILCFPLSAKMWFVGTYCSVIAGKLQNGIDLLKSRNMKLYNSRMSRQCHGKQACAHITWSSECRLAACPVVSCNNHHLRALSWSCVLGLWDRLCSQ